MNPMNAREKKNKMRLPLSVYLTYLLAATLLFTGISFSKFAATASGESSARVAVMAMNTEVEPANVLIAPGETAEITVILTNKEDDKVCEVAQVYSMSVETLTQNMNLSCVYSKDDGTAETLAESDTATGTFDAGVEQSVTYKVKITWNGGAQPASSAFEVDGLKISVKAEQID